LFEGKDHILIAGFQIEFVDWGYWSPQMPRAQERRREPQETRNVQRLV